jgi:hypothetical protein
MKSGIAFFFMSAILVLGCAEEKPKNKILNPNGDSELAILMREMFEDGMVTKQSLLEGKTPEVNVDYKAIHTSESTMPEKVASTEYMLFAKSYEASVEALHNAKPAHRAQAYHTMVDACVNCHKTVCQGPIVKINKMYFNDSERAKLAQVYE